MHTFFNDVRIFRLLPCILILSFMEHTSLAVQQGQTPAKSQREQGAGTHEVSNAETQQVCFMLSGGEYGVDISLVKEIIKPTMEPTPVPQSPFFVEGVIDLRGDIIPIIDLKKRFGVDSADSPTPTRILVIQLTDIIVGFLVDSVTEVIRARKENIQNAPGKVVGVDTEYIWGVTKRSPDSHLIMLLDVERILRIEDEDAVRGETLEMT
jgi:purine-binding chemotaxis protein CheW